MMSKIKEETGKLVSSLMVHPEKRILLLLRLHNLRGWGRNLWSAQWKARGRDTRQLQRRCRYIFYTPP